MSDRNDNVISKWDLYDGNEAMVWGVGDNHYYFRYELPQPNPTKWGDDWKAIYPLFAGGMSYWNDIILKGRYLPQVHAYKIVPDGIEPWAVSWTPIPAHLETGLTGTVKGEDPDWIAWTPKGTPQKVFRLPRIDLLPATEILESDTLVSGRRYSKKKASATLYLTAQNAIFLRSGPGLHPPREYYVTGDVKQWIWGYGGENTRLRIKNFLKADNAGNPSTEDFTSTQGGRWTLGDTIKAADNIFEWTDIYGDPIGTGSRGAVKPAGDGNFKVDGKGCMEHGIARAWGNSRVSEEENPRCGVIKPTGFLRIKADMSGLWKKHVSAGPSLVSDTVLLSSVKLTMNIYQHTFPDFEVLLKDGKPYSNISLLDLTRLWNPTGHVTYNTRKNIEIGQKMGIGSWGIFANIGYKYLFIPSDIFNPELHWNFEPRENGFSGYKPGKRTAPGDIPLCTNIELTYNNSVIMR
jgi:hypothetical protein